MNKISCRDKNKKKSKYIFGPCKLAFFIFGHCKFIFLILVLVSLFFFNFNLYKIFCLFLVFLSLYFSNFSPYKHEFIRTINEKIRILCKQKLKKHKLT